MNCTIFTYYIMLIIGQTYVCLIASSIKIITKRIAVLYQFKSAKMVETYMCVLGLRYANTAGAIKRP